MSFSTFSAIAEIFVTAAVLYVVYSSYSRKPFPTVLAFGTAIFEFCVNMFYMISRMGQVGEHPTLSTPMIILAALHGSLSLVVFIAYVTLALLAYMDARKGKFYFAEHRIVTVIFLVFWMTSVISGEVLYVLRFGTPVAEAPQT
ncbi:MAG: hypothetical protein K1X79_12940 [Oligoflexia bacterium]|nr:hypothetical protein [Oligoflexia bacterium]